MDTLEGNRIIAEFMGVNYIDNAPSDGTSASDVSYLLYHSSWDSLMPVVEKIRNIDWEEGGRELSERELSLIKAKEWLADYCILYCGLVDIWQAVVNFITWYNSQSN